MNRWYRVIGIFSKVLSVRHSNRRYQYHRELESSAQISRGTHHYAYALQTQVNWNKGKNRKDREERKGVLYSDSRSPCVKPKQALTLISCGQYIYGCYYAGTFDCCSSYDPEWLYRDALGNKCIDLSRGRVCGTTCGCGRMAVLSYASSMQENPRKYKRA